MVLGIPASKSTSSDESSTRLASRSASFENAKPLCIDNSTRSGRRWAGTSAARSMYQAAPESEKHRPHANVPIVGLADRVPQRWAEGCSRTGHDLAQSVQTRGVGHRSSAHGTLK